MSPAAAASVLRWATRLFGRDAAARVFEPLIADWQHEAAEAPHRRARALAHVRGALAFAANGAIVVVRGAEPMTRHASRASWRVLMGVLFVGLLQGVFRGFKCASTAAAVTIAVSCALSVLPALTVGVTRQRRFARAWRPLLLVTLFTLLAQVGMLTLAWPWIVSAVETPAQLHWVWRWHLLLASVLPGVLGIAAARVCSRHHAAPEMFHLVNMYPIWAWSDLYNSYGESVPGLSALAGLVFTVWAVNVIRKEHARRAQHQARVARYRRLPSTGR
jgi:hypothetical protein